MTDPVLPRRAVNTLFEKYFPGEEVATSKGLIEAVRSDPNNESAKDLRCLMGYSPLWRQGSCDPLVEALDRLGPGEWKAETLWRALFLKKTQDPLLQVRWSGEKQWGAPRRVHAAPCGEIKDELGLLCRGDEIDHVALLDGILSLRLKAGGRCLELKGSDITHFSQGLVASQREAKRRSMENKVREARESLAESRNQLASSHTSGQESPPPPPLKPKNNVENELLVNAMKRIELKLTQVQALSEIDRDRFAAAAAKSAVEAVKKEVEAALSPVKMKKRRRWKLAHSPQRLPREEHVSSQLQRESAQEVEKSFLPTPPQESTKCALASPSLRPTQKKQTPAQASPPSQPQHIHTEIQKPVTELSVSKESKLRPKKKKQQHTSRQTEPSKQAQKHETTPSSAIVRRQHEKSESPSLKSRILTKKKVQIRDMVDADLCEHGLVDADIAALCMGFLGSAQSSLAYLGCLDLSRNKIGDAGIEILCAALIEPNDGDSRARSLNLSNNRISLKGIQVLAKAIERNSSDSPLLELNLSNNPVIGARGSAALFFALKSNPPLRRLRLADCSTMPATDAWLCRKLADALPHNKNLELLDISRHEERYQNKDLAPVIAVFEHGNNTTLTQLTLLPPRRFSPCLPQDKRKNNFSQYPASPDQRQSHRRPSSSIDSISPRTLLSEDSLQCSHTQQPPASITLETISAQKQPTAIVSSTASSTSERLSALDARLYRIENSPHWKKMPGTFAAAVSPSPLSNHTIKSAKRVFTASSTYPHLKST